MTTEETALRTIAGLNLFPRKLRERLLDDPGFREAGGIEIGRMLTIDGGVARFDGDRLYGAIRRLYAARSPVQVKDEAGARWRVTKVSAGVTEHIVLSRNALSLRLAPEPGLDPNRRRRINGFQRMASAALVSSSFEDRWRAIIKERPLTNEENLRLESEFRETPHHVAGAISAGMERGESQFSELVPQSEAYFLELIGGRRRGKTLASYVEQDLPDHIERITDLNAEAGVWTLLRLCAHSSVADAIPSRVFDKVDVKGVVNRIREAGSLLSQIGILEALGPHLDVYDVEQELTEIAQQILTDNAKSKNSRFRLLSSLFVFVDGELSRTRVLANWPPTFRRLASLAHSALIEEQAIGRVRLGEFSHQLWDLRVHGFGWQSLTDLRIEPRWRPDFATPEQLKQETLSRILGAASKWRDKGSPQGKLSKIAFGKAKGSVHRRLHLIAAFRPGPLEGGEDKDLEDLTPELEEIVAGPLTAASPPTPQSFIPLLNISGTFRIRPEHIESAVRSIRVAGHRITGIESKETRSTIYQGLASVAAVQRSEALASELRTMLRYARNVGAQSVGFPEEFLIATIAAAASRDLETWCSIFGDWITELAFAIDDPQDAQQIRASLAKICHAVPELWSAAGRADAALEAFVASKTASDSIV